jgi:hypothetical protein
LSEGIDPIVTVLTENGQETMKLSEFMTRMGLNVPKKATPIKGKTKFTVHKGGKDKPVVPPGGDDTTTH